MEAVVGVRGRAAADEKPFPINFMRWQDTEHPHAVASARHAARRRDVRHVKPEEQFRQIGSRIAALAVAA